MVSARGAFWAFGGFAAVTPGAKVEKTP